jgi:RNA ligase (TIGR02306 family)
MSRKLITLRKIEDIKPIEDADFIEIAVVDGWNVVVKKGEFNVGDYAVYAEIDSFIPHELAPFLSTGTMPKVYKGVEGQRLKTKRLKGVYSQGLLLPFETLLDKDLSQSLNVKYYDPFETREKKLSTEALSKFPSFIPKTDLERVQNLKRDFNIWKDSQLEFEVTEKLDGSSVTIFLDKSELEKGISVLRVASRKEVKKDIPESIFWTGVRNEKIDELFLSYKDAKKYALQGELLGNKTGSTGRNIYSVEDYSIYIFDVFDILNGRYLTSSERNKVLDDVGISINQRVPCINQQATLSNFENELLSADGISKIAKVKREGLAYKCLSDTNIRFKIISNKWLLKYD